MPSVATCHLHAVQHSRSFGHNLRSYQHGAVRPPSTCVMRGTRPSARERFVSLPTEYWSSYLHSFPLLSLTHIIYTLIHTHAHTHTHYTHVRAHGHTHHTRIRVSPWHHILTAVSLLPFISINPSHKEDPLLPPHTDKSSEVHTRGPTRRWTCKKRRIDVSVLSWPFMCTHVSRQCEKPRNSLFILSITLSNSHGPVREHVGYWKLRVIQRFETNTWDT